MEKTALIPIDQFLTIQVAKNPSNNGGGYVSNQRSADEEVQAGDGAMEQLLRTIGAVLTDQRWIAIADRLAASKAKAQQSDDELRKQSHWISYVFSLVIFVGVGVMGWTQIIKPEAATGLVGMMIGYWFGTKRG